MPRVFRVMSAENGLPRIGKTARCLGVRPTEISVDAAGVVAPNSRDGMSVAPSWRQLPTHRIPARLKSRGAPDASGKDEDKCWRMGDGPFLSGSLAVNLRLQVTSADHGLVQPSHVMVLGQYHAALAATKTEWVVDEI